MNGKLMASVILAASLGLFGCTSSSKRDPSTASTARYVCPMDKAERTTPGPCPKCGMNLDERNLTTEHGDHSDGHTDHHH